MFFEEYSEFIEALYCVRYSKRDEEEKFRKRFYEMLESAEEIEIKFIMII